MPFMKSCGNYSMAGEAMLDSTAHAHFTLVPKVTKKQGICNNFFFVLFCGCTNASHCYVYTSNTCLVFTV